MGSNDPQIIPPTFRGPVDLDPSGKSGHRQISVKTVISGFNGRVIDIVTKKTVTISRMGRTRIHKSNAARQKAYRKRLKRPRRGLVGKTYLEGGKPVVILVQWGKGGGPRNVLIRRQDGTEVVRPFRGLSKVPKRKLNGDQTQSCD